VSGRVSRLALSSHVDTDVIRRGGVRAIVELEILQAIEEALGRHIPIQNFFDLIVGTR
jgi:hypothetical protein